MNKAAKAKDRITIQAPKAGIGQTVEVLNYRKRPAEWELGVVAYATYRPAFVGAAPACVAIPGRWSYDVAIERPEIIDTYGRRRGGGYTLSVSDDGIRPEAPGEAKQA